MKSKAKDVELQSYNDIFLTYDSRAEQLLPKIRDIPISEIDDFPDHPFHVRENDDDMVQLIESIKIRGVITPATLRQKDDGRYELISGHRIKRAYELAGMETLKAEVKDLTRDEAIILMVDSNLQRSVILPSERAFSYKMRLEAMNRQGQRTDLDKTYSPLANKLKTSSAVLADEVGTSKDQIFRYIRLTHLIPDILQMVDDRRIAFRPAVEISFIPPEQQSELYDIMDYNDATPSLAQTIKIREFLNKGELSTAVMESIISEQKPNQCPKSRFDERITRFIPDTVQKDKTEGGERHCAKYTHPRHHLGAECVSQ